MSPPADCPKPQGNEKIVLTDAALLRNDFPDGIEITYECAKGYTIESGSGLSMCQDGIWREPDLTCISELWLPLF